MTGEALTALGDAIEENTGSLTAEQLENIEDSLENRGWTVVKQSDL